MALQGTLDTFALPDVLRLLAATRKTGRLRITGGRGSGSVWVDAGQVVATEASGAPTAERPVDVVFELLRYKDGSFTFEGDRAAPSPGAPAEVEPLLVEAEQQLDEWRGIEAVVPSLDAWVSLVPELPRPDVVVDAERWRAIVAVGSGASVRSLGEALAMPEVPVSRQVKDLVELGLVSVGSAPPEPVHTPEPVHAPEPAAFEPEPEPAAFEPEREPEPPAEPPAPVIAFPEPVHEPVAMAEPSPRHEPSPEPAVEVGRDDVVPATVPVPRPPLAAVPQMPARRALPRPVGDDEADEVARQLASLSPKAAKAVAAAAHASTDEEREAALAEASSEDDEPINRGLLLKFLSSVRT